MFWNSMFCFSPFCSTIHNTPPIALPSVIVLPFYISLHSPRALPFFLFISTSHFYFPLPLPISISHFRVPLLRFALSTSASTLHSHFSLSNLTFTSLFRHPPPGPRNSGAAELRIKGKFFHNKMSGLWISNPANLDHERVGGKRTKE
jgi:hypothetical protein